MRKRIITMIMIASMMIMIGCNKESNRETDSNTKVASQISETDKETGYIFEVKNIVVTGMATPMTRITDLINSSSELKFNEEQMNDLNNSLEDIRIIAKEAENIVKPKDSNNLSIYVDIQEYCNRAVKFANYFEDGVVNRKQESITLATVEMSEIVTIINRLSNY